MQKLTLFFSICFFIFAGCLSKKTNEKGENSMKNIEMKEFGKLNDSTSAVIYTLSNEAGMKVAITNFGGHILSILVPDRNGKFTDVTHGCDSLSQYVKGTFFGPITGRFGNRIANGQFILDGKTYKLFKNNGPNTLHGGKVGFDKKLWAASIIDGNEPALVLKYISPDMEEGFPGELTIQVTYTLQKDNAIRIDYQATTNKPTVINLTNHAYFNLAGANGTNNILDHVLTLYADKITPVDKTLIPTGELMPVAGTPFDFQKPTKIGARIDDTTHIQIKYGGGYDHNFVFTDTSNKLKLGAKVSEPTSGRVLEMYTTEPAVQLYTANFLRGTTIGKGGVKYNKRSGFCLETQHFPDSPNQAQFPSTVLRPGENYQTTTIYKFSTTSH
jgi:aldose 1-epimerase